jgi:hypothetical protein
LLDARCAGERDAEPASYHSSIKRYDTDCGGGSPGTPAATSSRVNQRASSSSSSVRIVASAEASAMKPIMSDEGNGHGCEE